jgi:DNA-binding NtrC family response regulator
MEEKEKLIILASTPSLYDFLKDSRVAADYALYYHGKEDDPGSFIRENVIRTIILEADEAPEADFELIDRLKKADPLLNIVVISPPGPPDELLDWIRRGAADVIARPADVEVLHASLAKIVEKNDLRRETFQLEKRLEKKYVFQGIVSKNPVMFEVFSTIEQISRFFSSVLITGETGTGKEMIARAIHALSGVRNRRLVVCDCASIPENLFESELFGYVRGAFTGADRNKRGLFEEAHEGAIFLDEIGEIPLPVQAKLLRVLENRQFRPLGSNEVKSIDVRVIAATNRDLSAMLRSGGFREDLIHRLNRVEIHIPPLRERREDIPLLIRNFLDQINRSYSKDLKGVSREVQKLFLKYDWPGNVRELENVLQSAAMIGRKDFLDVADLPKSVREANPARPGISVADGEKLVTLEDIERDYIAFVLKATGFNLKKTAATLKISRTTLYNKMARYVLTRE